MEFDALYLRVLKFLNFRPRSEKEVREYLKKILRQAQEKNFSTRSTRSKKKRHSEHIRFAQCKRSEESNSWISDHSKSSSFPEAAQVQDDREEIATSFSNGELPRNDNSNSLVNLVVHKLKQQKFLNDADFARWLVRSRTAFKPKGKYVVAQELRQKGIAQDIIDEVLDSERTISEEDLATDVLSHKKRKYEPMEPRERFAKAGAMLARRGFNLDAIKTAIDRVFGKMV